MSFALRLFHSPDRRRPWVFEWPPALFCKIFSYLCSDGLSVVDEMKLQRMNWRSTIGKCLLAGAVACTAGGCTLSGKNGMPEGNSALENIFSRTSVRTYQERDVEPQTIGLLLRAGMSAPSGRDLRPWEFIVVDRRPVLDSLAAALPYAKMLATAPCAVIVCGSPARSSYWYLDCSAAAQNILLAANALGLGSVWTAAYPYAERMEAVGRNVGLPEGVLPLCVIPIGYPASPEAPKEKFDESRVHYNTW